MDLAMDTLRLHAFVAFMALLVALPYIFCVEDEVASNFAYWSENGPSSSAVRASYLDISSHSTPAVQKAISHRRGSYSDSKTAGFTSNIIEGSYAEDGRYPYMCVVFIERDTGGVFNCGGTLIDAKTVLTAAHCFFTDTDEVWVKCGSIEKFRGTHSNAVSYTLHEQFIKGKTPDGYDIAIVELETEIEGPYPILNADKDIPSTDASVQVIGFGRTSFGDKAGSMKLKVGTLKTISRTQCENKLQPMDEYMLCMTHVNDYPCKGDSGGPVVLPSASDEAKDDILIGVHSFSTPDCSGRTPSVSGRISYFYDWITSKMTYPHDGSELNATF